MDAFALHELPRGALDAAAALSIAVGALICFFGYRLYRFVLALAGFVWVGAVAGGVAHASGQGPAMMALAALAGGVVGAVLFIFFYYVGVFSLGALLGAGVGFAIAGLIGHGPNHALLLVLGIGGGIAALHFLRFVVVVTTSFGGAHSVIIGVHWFMGGPLHAMPVYLTPAEQRTALMLTGLWLALSVAGLVTQFAVTAERPEDELERDVRREVKRVLGEDGERDTS